MTDFKNKDITIKSFEMTKTKNGKTMFKLNDQDNVKFIFFKTKNDGDDTEVYGSWKALNLDEGRTVRISYVTEEYESNGKQLSSNKIIAIIKEVAPVTIERIAPTQQDNHGKRLALHGMVNGMLASGKTPAEVKQSIPALVALEDVLERAVNISASEEELNIEEDIPLDEPPF